MRIAIVGSGIAGLSCAHVLGPTHEVVLYEADERLGGHANTVTVDDPEAGPIGVDTGFIVHNQRNYPNLTRLFGELGVALQETEMSFSVTDRDYRGRGDLFTYRATSLGTLFADRRNLTRPAMWRMLYDISRFYRNANQLLEEADDEPGAHADTTLAGFLSAGRYSSVFVEQHMIPLGAAVWSADPASFDAYPAVTLFRFLANHGLLGLRDRPQWLTVVGGSRHYVDALTERFRGEIRLGTPVLGLRRDDTGVTLRTASGEERHDEVVLACHSDQALALLDDASADEKEVLGSIGYQPNKATLHTDTSVLSPNRSVWGAWNYERPRPGIDPQGVATVTYDLTNLQRLEGSRRYLVSLNSDHRIDPDQVIASFDYSHPVFDTEAVAAQQRFDDIDGVIRTHFCGAYWGYGFHEDGISSALRVCEKLGVSW
jgi:predicted NAD/FAD-binding protein